MTERDDKGNECSGHHGHGRRGGKHRKPDFFGFASVGERGQIVIPAGARKAHDIKPGDKLIVAGGKGNQPLLLLKAEVLTDKIEHLTKELDFLRGIEETEAE